MRSLAYTLSLSIKEVLIFILPFIIFSLIFHSINQLQNSNAFKIIVLLVFTIIISNITSVTIASFIGIKASALLSNNNIILPTVNRKILEPLYQFHLPTIINNSYALISGFFVSIILSKIMKDKATKIANTLLYISTFILKKIFITIIPIFIIGFIFKMHDDKILISLPLEYIAVLFLLFTCAYVYVILLYIISNNFILHKTILSIKNMIPALILAFSTMSSLITMPVTLSASQKNSNNYIANIVIPSVTNIHLIGDCFFIIILSLIISSTFQQPINSTEYLLFTIYFVILKFADAAVPGTGIVVMIPILQQYLHFSPTMISLMAILYIIFEPIITSINVFGNGAFAIIFFQIYKCIFLRKKGNLP
ncbi:cation:dicarboxylate symporter family transporter [Candidatus Neoehrlichia procyonis]|uniref:cation:dicarboxylate symporter family transporter n=1 Tax=Candidatus Neoehrlichia procyonis TaxID=467750 RepID=UPI001E4192A8|nr:cation:dicarboxylase symporter family transporter [Candidatus Neoehrlichia lotoris]